MSQSEFQCKDYEYLIGKRLVPTDTQKEVLKRDGLNPDVVMIPIEFKNISDDPVYIFVVESAILNKTINIGSPADPITIRVAPAHFKEKQHNIRHDLSIFALIDLSNPQKKEEEEKPPQYFEDWLEDARIAKINLDGKEIDVFSVDKLINAFSANERTDDKIDLRYKKEMFNILNSFKPKYHYTTAENADMFRTFIKKGDWIIQPVTPMPLEQPSPAI